MKYAYEDLSEKQFEILTIFICQELFGIGVQGFATGPDGGRDAKFVGTAERHPSTAAPWMGTTIIQAKHTNGHNRHFKETEFFNPGEIKPNSVLGQEIPRIKNLIASKGLDNYMLVSNRRLAGGAEAEIVDHISNAVELPKQSIHLCGIEQLEILLQRFPDIAIRADLDPVDSPLLVSPNDLSVIVQALSRNVKSLTGEMLPTPRIPYAEKNEINKMTPDYAKLLRTRYLKETKQIGEFLSAPENAELLDLYESVAEEFQFKIIAKRKDHQNFDEVLEYLFDLLFKRDPILRQHGNKRLTRAVLFYMYWICDIGKTEDVTA